MARRHQEVGLAGACRPDETEVLSCPQPLQGGQVVHGCRWHGGNDHLEVVEALVRREAGAAQPGGLVGGIPSSDLRGQQGPQQLLRRPPLGGGGLQDLGGLEAEVGQLDPLEASHQVRGQGWSLGGHGRTARPERA